MIMTLVLVIVYILSVFGAMKMATMEKEKIEKEDGPILLAAMYLPVFNTLLAVIYAIMAFIEWNRNLLNKNIDEKIKEDFKKKVDEQHPNTTLQTPQYDRMTKIELDLDKFNIPNEAWLLIYEWEKLKYEEGVYVGNVFPQEAKMNNPIQCKNLFESIKETAEKLTSGNVAHHKNEIIHLAQRGIENITEK